MGPDTYRIHGYMAPLLTGIEERLIPSRIPRKPGDIEYRRCPKCGVPVELSEFEWNLEDGIIRHRDTGLRFAFIGPVGLQIICDELEAEIGESIPEAIIEAQRMHSQSVVGDLWQRFLSDDFRKWLGVLGMGNLVSVELEGDVLSARIENSALPLMTMGTAIAIREHATGGKVEADWSLAEDGDLTFTVG